MNLLRVKNQIQQIAEEAEKFSIIKTSENQDIYAEVIASKYRNIKTITSSKSRQNIEEYETLMKTIFEHKWNFDRSSVSLQLPYTEAKRYKLLVAYN